MIRFTILAVFMLLGCMDRQAHAATKEWKLMGRHGECVPIASLKRKLPDLPDIRSPDDLAAHLDLNRHKYTRNPLKSGPAVAVAFQVPDVGLAIILVESRHCTPERTPVR